MATSTDDEGATAPTLPQEPPSGERVLTAKKHTVRGGALLGKRRSGGQQRASEASPAASGSEFAVPAADELQSGIQPRLRADPRHIPKHRPEPRADDEASIPDEQRLDIPPDAGSRPDFEPVDGFGDLDEEQEERETEAPDLYIGRTVAERYEIASVIGEGGMGRVYLAHHNRLGKEVAIKILHADLARDKAAVGRFVREARAASSIGNPHIVDVSDFGELPDGSTYFVMEHLAGATLADLLDEKDVLDPAVVVDIGKQLCDGLAAAHEQDIIHRDLKPENVVLVERNDNPRFCKILDFGIAKVSAGTAGGHTKLTLAGTVFGTPHYMSPEQAAGSTVDHRADIYSLGVMLYEMAAGDLPFDADNFMGLLTQHMYKAPPHIRGRTLGEGCPPGLEAVILKCLAKRPEARYDSMEDLADDLGRVTDGLRPEALDDDEQATARIAIPAEFLERARLTQELAPSPAPWKRVAGVGLVVGLAVGGLGYSLARQGTSESTAEASVAPSPVTPPPAPVPSTTAPTSPSSATPSPETSGRQVLLHSPIPGAVAYVDDEPILLPANVTLAEGETKQVEVAAKGYRRKKTVLDGRQERVTVALVPLPGRPGDPYDDIADPAPVAPKPKTKRPSADVIVEPWDP